MVNNIDINVTIKLNKSIIEFEEYMLSFTKKKKSKKK